MEQTNIVPGYVIRTPEADRPQISAEERRKLFLAERQTGVGGSDIGVISGLNQYQTVYELWLEKTGQLEPADLSDNKKVQFGNDSEDFTLDMYAKQSGKIIDATEEAKSLVRNPDCEFMICHLDARIKGENGIVEAKSAGANMYKHFDEEQSDGIPESYLLQGQHNMACSQADFCEYPVLALWIPGLITFRVERDNKTISLLKELVEEFWQHVVDRTPPEFDATHPAAGDAVKRIFPGVNGEIVQLSAELYEAHLVLEAAKVQRKIQEDIEESMKAKIRFFMGECSTGLFPDGSGYNRNFVAGSTFTVNRKESVQMRYAKQAGKKGKAK